MFDAEKKITFQVIQTHKSKIQIDWVIYSKVYIRDIIPTKI